MGTGKVLPTLVILSISVMMVFSILPAYANHIIPHDKGICTDPGGEERGPWTVETNGGADVTVEKFHKADRNENGWICFMETNTGKKIIRDDRVQN